MSVNDLHYFSLLVTMKKMLMINLVTNIKHVSLNIRQIL